ncbi:DUF4231 domain-containing protein [Actinoplanes sp. CA-142083]|uniref:DUF4231 domain-containing protein n=1 Tax=Actinoplanes sp. CA-142083 TaxID=3239903 RepID=UPI003D8A38A6
MTSQQSKGPELSELLEHAELEQRSRVVAQVADRDYAYISGSGNVVMGAGNVVKPHEGATEEADQAQLYLSDLERELSAVSMHARRRLLTYRLLRFLALAASAVTPAVALLDAAPFITATIGTVAFLSEGAIQLTRINERAVLDTKRATALNREFRMYRTKVGDYETADRSFTLLVKRVEEIREANDNERLAVVQQSFGAQPTINGPGDARR